MPLRVLGVDRQSPCAGLIKQYDLITAVNGTPLETIAVLRETLAGVEPGSALSLSLERGGQPLTIEIIVPESRSLGLDVDGQKQVSTPIGPAGQSTAQQAYGSAGVTQASLTTDSLKAAQDRTTHAVRAIAFFILILFPATFLGALLFYWGLAIQDGEALVFVGGITSLVGTIWAIAAGWTELSRSTPR